MEHALQRMALRQYHAVLKRHNETRDRQHVRDVTALSYLILSCPVCDVTALSCP